MDNFGEKLNYIENENLFLLGGEGKELTGDGEALFSEKHPGNPLWEEKFNPSPEALEIAEDINL